MKFTLDSHSFRGYFFVFRVFSELFLGGICLRPFFLPLNYGESLLTPEKHIHFKHDFLIANHSAVGIFSQERNNDQKMQHLCDFCLRSVLAELQFLLKSKLGFSCQIQYLCAFLLVECSYRTLLCADLVFFVCVVFLLLT